MGSGGGETKGTQRLRRSLHDHGWRKHNFQVQRTIDGVAREFISHEVDHVARFDAGVVALEIELEEKGYPFLPSATLRTTNGLTPMVPSRLACSSLEARRSQDEMRSMVPRFATEKGVPPPEDLRRIGPQPDDPASPPPINSASVRGTASRKAGPRASSPTSSARPRPTGASLKTACTGAVNPCPLLLIGLPSSLVTFGEPEAVVEELVNEGEEPFHSAGISSPNL